MKKHSNICYRFSPDADYSLEPKWESFIEKIGPESPQSSDKDDEEDSSTSTLTPTPTPAEPQPPNESIRLWLQRISQMQNEIQKKLKSNSENQPNPPTIKTFSDFIASKAVHESPPKATRVVKYEDLPYMGEMTLDNSKPRRGRKPKKADICHLIYKNYGTVFPGTPEDKDLSVSKQQQVYKANVQNKIISSLLEKRLTQETSTSNALGNRILASGDSGQNEPLNLCIRDLDHLKIRLPKREPEDEVEIVANSCSSSPTDQSEKSPGKKLNSPV